MKLIPLFLACLLSTGAHAEWVDKQGQPLSDAEDRKSNRNFGAQLIFTTEERELFRKWATPSETVDLNTVDSVRIDQPVSAFIIFGGCKPNASGNCSVSMRFKVIQPDGKTYSETPTMEVWHNKPAPPGRSLELSAEYLKVRVEPHEQRGPYTVQTQVRDDNTGVVLFLQKVFTALDSEELMKHKPALNRTPASGRPLP